MRTSLSGYDDIRRYGEEFPGHYLPLQIIWSKNFVALFRREPRNQNMSPRMTPDNIIYKNTGTQRQEQNPPVRLEWIPPDQVVRKFLSSSSGNFEDPDEIIGWDPQERSGALEILTKGHI